MQSFILAALVTVALASEIYPQAEYQPVPAYLQPQYPQQSYKTNGKTEDYSPKPYSFDYVVKDDHTYADFSHNEYSDGKAVSGTYRVVLPDSRVQIVSYKDEGYGLIADVKYEGIAQYQEYNKPAYKPTYPVAYEQATPAYNQPKPVYEQPKLSYDPPKAAYETSEYVAQPSQHPSYKPAPVPYKFAPVAYPTSPASYKPVLVSYNPSLVDYKPSPAAYSTAPVAYKSSTTTYSAKDASYPSTESTITKY